MLARKYPLMHVIMVPLVVIACRATGR